MPSKKKLQLQSKIKELIKKYVKLLKLEGWQIDTILSKKDILSYSKGKIKKVSPDFYAEVIYNHLTKSASIVVTKEEDLEDTIFHEMLHILLAPLVELTEAAITVADIKKDKALQLLKQVDEQEHLLIQTIIKLYQEKQSGK